MDSGNSSDYSYSNAGFDPFLTRSLDVAYQATLQASEGTQPNQQVAFDRTQVTGALGDSVTIGNITLDGVGGRIDIKDDQQNVVVRIGEQNA